MAKVKSNTDSVTQAFATVNDLSSLQETLKEAELLQIPREQLQDSYEAEEKFKVVVETVRLS